MSKKKTNEEFSQKLKDLNIPYKPLEEYKDAKTKIKMYCEKHDCTWEIAPSDLYNRRKCPKCIKENSLKERKLNFEKKFYAKFPNHVLLTDYISTIDNILVKCPKGHKNWTTPVSVLHSQTGCIECSHQNYKRELKDEDTIYVKRPDLIKYFQKPDDAKMYPPGSNERYDFVCPNCGFRKNMIIYQLTKQHFVCDKCSDGFSFPNTILRMIAFELEKQGLEILEFEKYYKTEGYNFFYDGAFKHQDKTILIEMDGGFHFRPHPKSKISLEETKRQDDFKTKYAQDILGAILIRIPCPIGSLEEIKQGFYNSCLSKWFNLDLIDWEECERKSQNSFIKIVCDYYEENKYSDFEVKRTILKKFKISNSVMKKYFRIGERLGWCKQLEVKPGYMPIKCYYKNHILEGCYCSIVECVKELQNKYKIYFTENVIRHRIKGRADKFFNITNEDGKEYCFYFKEMDKLEYLQYLKSLNDSKVGDMNG